MEGFFRKDFLTSPFNGESPFASADGGEIPNTDGGIISLYENEVSIATFEKGFSSRFVGDSENLYQTDGQKTWGAVSTFNALGFYMTQALFLQQMGYFPTFHKEVSDAIGGYPKGAILKYISDGSKSITFNDLPFSPEGWIMNVISLQDNNTKNFVYDAETNPEPYEIGSADENGVVWWKFVVEHMPSTYSSVLPDLTTGIRWNPKDNEKCVTGNSLAFVADKNLGLGRFAQVYHYDYDLDNSPVFAQFGAGVMTPALASSSLKFGSDYDSPSGMSIVMYQPRYTEIPEEIKEVL